MLKEKEIQAKKKDMLNKEGTNLKKEDFLLIQKIFQNTIVKLTNKFKWNLISLI